MVTDGKCQGQRPFAGGGVTITPSAHVAASDISRQPRKRSSRQAARPAPLPSAANRLGRDTVNALTFKLDQSVGPVSGGADPKCQVQFARHLRHDRTRRESGGGSATSEWGRLSQVVGNESGGNCND